MVQFLLRSYYNYIISVFSFLPQCAPSLLLFKYVASFINTHTHTCTRKYINVMCLVHIMLHVYVFRILHLVFCKQLVRSSLGKTISPALSILYLLVVLWLVLWLHEFSLPLLHQHVCCCPRSAHVYADISVRLHCCSFSDIERSKALTENFLFLWLFQSFHPALRQ